jgi:signal transduction histidine kinase
MTELTDTVEPLTHRWLRRRFALPLIAALGAVMLIVSEQTYRATTTTLRGGIELTDARIQSLGLLQTLSEAETAEFAFVATGQEAYLDRLEAAKRQLPSLLGAVTDYFKALDGTEPADVRRITALTTGLADRFDRTLGLARAGDRDAAVAALKDEGALRTMTELRSALQAQLARATTLQGQARTSIYRALFVNRLAVGSLTLIAMLSLFLFQRQLHLRDRERNGQRDRLLAERSQLEDEVERRTSELAELARHLQTVREDERSSLARELHDELGSLLTAGKIEIARARSKVNDPAAVLERLDRVIVHMNSAIKLKRRIIEDLRPSSLSNLGLMASLEILCSETSETLGIPVRFSPGDLKLTEASDLTVYRFVQEALTNSAKYAEAGSIDVEVTSVGSDAVITVRDDGAGFDPMKSRVGHHGLSGMTFRATSLGGSMSVVSAPGAGASLKIVLPLV